MLLSVIIFYSFIAEWCSIVWIYHSLSIHKSTGIRVVSVWGFVNNVAISIGTQGFVWTDSLTGLSVSRKRILGHNGKHSTLYQNWNREAGTPFPMSGLPVSPFQRSCSLALAEPVTLPPSQPSFTELGWAPDSSWTKWIFSPENVKSRNRGFQKQELCLIDYVRLN